ncbi:MAG: bifunctional oligoribonuclease/PAP phosphatase NrnA [Armatimonadetes bacterium]|nr:bifunctional oligoribonuclease/PAP phosphatase NrnA [Armatimonadota bacterium]
MKAHRTHRDPQFAAMDQVAEAIASADTIMITTHINPDGDAIGSALGLRHILCGLGKTVQVVSQDGAGQRYKFLPGAQTIQTSADRPYDLGIAVDCGGLDRVGNVREALLRCGKVVRVDHHAVGESFGDIEYIDAQAAAVGEMITALAERMGASISEEAGECLLASIVEDTGCFQYESVSPKSFRICADLVEAGADLHRVVRNLFWQHSEGATRMSGHCLEALKMECSGRLAWTVARDADFARYRASHEDMDDVVHELLSIAGVEVAILLRETQEDYRVSLRSRDYVDVADVAREFKGGGHRRAAGCRITRSDSAVDALIASAAKRLK